MLQHSRDKGAPHGRELILSASIKERVGVALKERHVGVHTGTGVLGHGLGHKRGIHALLDGHLLDDGAERHDVVRCSESIGVAQIDLILPGSSLVVAELDRNSEVFEHSNRATAEIVGASTRDIIEIARRIDRLRTVLSVTARLQKIKLNFGVGIEGETQVGGFFQLTLEDKTGIGHRRLTIGCRDVAEHPGGRVNFSTPGQNLERGGVRVRQNIGFKRTGKALNGGTIYTQAFSEGALNLGWRNRHHLESSHDVGEPEADELHSALLNCAQNKIALFIHHISFEPMWRG